MDRRDFLKVAASCIAIHLSGNDAVMADMPETYGLYIPGEVFVIRCRENLTYCLPVDEHCRRMGIIRLPEAFHKFERKDCIIEQIEYWFGLTCDQERKCQLKFLVPDGKGIFVSAKSRLDVGLSYDGCNQATRVVIMVGYLLYAFLVPDAV